MTPKTTIPRLLDSADLEPEAPRYPGTRMRPHYRLVRWLFALLGKLFLRLEIHGAENIPPLGPVMFLPTHTSHLDPPLIGAAVKREMAFVAREGILTAPITGWFCRWLNGFPIRRGESDRQALRFCRSLLRHDWAVTFFPEGTRSPDGRLGKLQGGFALILEGVPGVPYVPVVMQDTYRAWPRGRFLPRPAKVRIHIGAPQALPERKPDERPHEYFARCVRALEEQYRTLGAQ